MLLVKFELEDLEKCKTVSDVYRAMGIGVRKDDPQDLNLHNKEVFGRKAYYKNLFLTDATYQKILKLMEDADYKGGRNKVWTWVNFAPLSNGPRYDKVREALGDLNDSVLYIATPEDEIYEESYAPVE